MWDRVVYKADFPLDNDERDCVFRIMDENTDAEIEAFSKKSAAEVTKWRSDVGKMSRG